MLAYCIHADDGIRGVTVGQTSALPSGPACRRSPSGGSQAEDSMRDTNVVKKWLSVKDRKSVVWGRNVDIGGRRMFNKKKTKRANTAQDESNNEILREITKTST